jgi:hypothetical protein
VLLNVPLMVISLNVFVPVALVSVNVPVTVVIPATAVVNAPTLNVPLVTVRSEFTVRLHSA